LIFGGRARTVDAEEAYPKRDTILVEDAVMGVVRNTAIVFAYPSVDTAMVVAATVFTQAFFGADLACITIVGVGAGDGGTAAAA
jgi:hypothetical protein